MPADRPTIIDVARAAGVSKSVVSRVITGNGAVSAKTRDEVHRAMESLGYRLNVAARSLVSGSSGNVGLLLRNVEADFYSTLFTRLQQHASEAGSRIVGTTGNMAAGSETLALDSLLELGVDGLIIGSGTMPVRTIGRLADRIATVVVTRPARDTAASAVYDDPDQHAALCVSHLWDAGHRFVALFDHQASLSALPRVDSIRREANERGMRLSTFEGGYDLEPGMDAGRLWLGRRSGETALLFLSFRAALGAAWTLQRGGLRVPEDVSIVVADGFHQPNPYAPDFASSTRDEREFAAAVWTELAARLGDRPGTPREIRVPVTWSGGTTLGPPASAGSAS